MTTSSRSEVDAGRRVRFSPLRVSIVAVAAMAALAIGLVVFPRSGPGPGIAGSHEPTPTALGTPPERTLEPTHVLEPTPTPTPTPTQVSTPTPEPTPTPIAGWTGLTWSDPETPSFVVHLNDLVPWRDGYVAVGSMPVGAGLSQAAFLTSPDGLNWTVRYQIDPAGERFPADLVAYGGELYAFSRRAADGVEIIVEPPLRSYSGPLIWRSADGISWTMVDSASWEGAWRGLRLWPMPADWDKTQHPIPTGLVDVASGPDGLVVIGNSFGDSGLIPIVLRSTDGQAWSEISLPADSTSPLLESVVSHDDGFVAVGAVDAGPRTHTATPAAWFSTDGDSWACATVTVDPRIFPSGIVGIGDEMGDVTAGADGLVGWWGHRGMVAGGPRLMAAWTSADGRTWQPRDLDTALPRLAHGYLAGDGVRMLALGPAPNTATDPAMWPGISQGWVSTDGITWTTLDMPSELDDWLERMWVVPDGVVYAGVQSFWFGTPTIAP